MPPAILKEPRPWAFSHAELLAGLRWYSGDPTLRISGMEERALDHRRPAVGRIRRLSVTCAGSEGPVSFDLVLKEPKGITRAGMAGAGWREVSLYRTLSEQMPIRMPELVGAHPDGDWLAINLVAGGRDPLRWTADDYLAAIHNLVSLHDRFWDLGEDLALYTWLGRPLGGDFQVHLKTARASVDRLMSPGKGSPFAREVDLLAMLNHVVSAAPKIAAELKTMPYTLIHGDYFPGNISIFPDGSLVTYDWQRASVAPGILDLVNFIQLSLWWFEKLPLPATELVHAYRARLAQANGAAWTDEKWQQLWDNALLWVFLSDWIDLLTQAPTSLIRIRRTQLETVWLQPVARAARRLAVI